MDKSGVPSVKRSIFFKWRPCLWNQSFMILLFIYTPITHKSTVARTVMCRQDDRGWFPVLLDDLSKCRTNSQRKSQLRIFYMTFTLNDIYKQYNKLHEHWYTKISSLRCAEDRNPLQKCIRLVYEIQVICRTLQALYSTQLCELMKKIALNCSYRIFIIWRSPVSPFFWARILLS